jgi:hypothetical protein
MSFDTQFFRGGPSLLPRRDEVRVDRTTGLLRTSHGVSVFDRSDHPLLLRHGGAFRVSNIPRGLQIKQRGRDPSHHEIVPAIPMTFEEFEILLAKITLTLV